MMSTRANWYLNRLAEDMSLESVILIGQRDVIGLVWAYFSTAITGDLVMTMQAKYAKSNVSNCLVPPCLQSFIIWVMNEFKYIFI